MRVVPSVFWSAYYFAFKANAVDEHLTSDECSYAIKRMYNEHWNLDYTVILQQADDEVDAGREYEKWTDTAFAFP